MQILFVEDDPFFARYVPIMLKKTDVTFEIEHTSNLVGALAFLQASSADVIILDLNIQDSSGASTLERIRNDYPAVPVIVLTGIEGNGLSFQLQKLNVSAYIYKSNLTASILMDAIEKVQRKGLAVNPSSKPERLETTKVEAFRNLATHGGKEELFDFINIYLASIPILFFQMREAIKAHDSAMFRKATKDLQGLCVGLGAESMLEQCLLLKEAGETASAEELRAAVDKIEKTFSEVKANVTSRWQVRHKESVEKSAVVEIKRVAEDQSSSLLKLFLKQLDQALPAIEDSVRYRQMPTLRKVANMMKSSAANVGARALSTHFSDLEVLADDGSRTDFRDLVKAIQEEAERVKQGLDPWVNPLEPAPKKKAA